jgi:RluA family pseudouridine synthase
MIIIDEHTVPDEIPQIRLVDYLPGIFKLIPSKAASKKAIRRGQVLIDGKVAEGSRWITTGQKILLAEDETSLPKIFELPLEVIFEDEFMAVVVKPSGYRVSGNEFKTIQNAILFNLKVSAEKDALRLPRPIHRLDVPTSGLLIFAKTSLALMNLGQQMANHKIKKRYRAIVAGKTPGSGIIGFPINNLEAKTAFATIKQIHSLKTGWLSLVDLFPETGRKHQLRIHLSQLGFPIVGDKKYHKNSPLLKGKGLFLSAVELEFTHPVNEEKINVKIDQPDKFNGLLSREESRWKKYN